MPRILLLISGFMIMLACKRSENKSVTKDAYLIPKGRLKSVIDSFVQVAGNKHPCYEIYINKWSPFESDIIIFSGNRSLTTLENKLEGQFPLAKTLAMGVTFDIYSGGERYFNRPENAGKEGALQDESKKPEEVYAMWVIKDSSGVFSMHPVNGAYPFIRIPDPIPDSLIKFTPPVIPSGENDK